MSFNEDVKRIDNSTVLDITKLISKLCFMTGCDQEIAMMQLLNSDYDLQLAADKILETMPNNKQVDNGWQTINRQKKSKKKEVKKEDNNNDEHVKKIVSNRPVKSSYNSDTRPRTFKNDERQNNVVRSQNKRNRNIIAKNNLELSNSNNYNNSCHNTNEKTIASNSIEMFDLHEELRWDNLGDIEGGLKESRNNSFADCFYSDDDFDFPDDYKNEPYQDIGIKMVPDMNNIFDVKVNSENDSKYSDQSSTIIINTTTATTSTNNETVISQSNSSDSKLILECLMHQLPVFGKFSKTQQPKSLPIIPTKPVSFALPIKLHNKCGKFRYNFGVNFSELLIGTTATPCSDNRSFTIPTNTNCKPSAIPQVEHRDNLFNLNQFHNTLIGANHPNFNNLVIHGPVPKQQPNVKEILHTILKQKQAILLAQQQGQPYYPLSKSISLVPMTNSNPMYSMQMNPDSHVLYKDIDNGLTHQNPDYFLKNLFPTTNNISVPFQLAKK